jgi:hypothetical protein
MAAMSTPSAPAEGATYDESEVPYVALDIDPNATWEEIVEMLGLSPAKEAE